MKRLNAKVVSGYIIFYSAMDVVLTKIGFHVLPVIALSVMLVLGIQLLTAGD